MGLRGIRAEKGSISIWFAWFVSVMLLISCGFVYRYLATRLRLVVDTPVELPVLLTSFPKRIGPWVGKDMPIAPNILRAAGNDASLKRLYTNETSNQWANLYIAYTAHPRTMLGHRPRICYVAGGWVHDSTQEVTIRSTVGRVVPCLIHRFHQPAPSNEEIIVLNFYIVNGQLTSDDRVFSGVGWRTPNINGDPARYVTQVQVSSILENSIRHAAEEMVELILDFFPDEAGRVKAVEYIESSNRSMK
jgi:hypothetical protein